MRDVARAAGVSQTTVSFVLNDVPDVHIGERTRQRVLATIDRLGYRPNAVARGLRRAKTDTIGFIWNDAAPLPGTMVQGAQEAAHVEGSLLLLASTGGDALAEQDAGAVLVDRRVDGIVCATSDHRVVLPAGHLRTLPSVLLGCEARDASMPAVVADHAAAASDGTFAMARAGRRSVAFVAAPGATLTQRSRLAGYRRALAAHGLEPEDDLVRTCDGEAAAYEAVRSLLERDPRPDGLLCSAHALAAGAYRAVFEAGLRIPDDVAVMAFDDHELCVPPLRPALSTIAMPHVELGRLAVETLLETITAEASPARRRRVRCALHLRESV